MPKNFKIAYLQAIKMQINKYSLINSLKMKTKTRNQTKTKLVLINAELQQNNDAVEKAYTAITNEASELLRKFELAKYRTHLSVEHCKDPQNTNLVREFISYFWNVTLSNSKEGKSYIFISIDENGLEKFGSGLTNLLLRSAFKITDSINTEFDIQYAMRVNYMPMDIHNFFYRRIVEGETDLVSIYTVEQLTS